jgi:hypothetical protein
LPAAHTVAFMHTVPQVPQLLESLERLVQTFVPGQ